MLATSLSPNISPANTLESDLFGFPPKPRSNYDQSTTKSASSRPAIAESTNLPPRKHPLSSEIELQKPRRLHSTKSLDRYKRSPRFQTCPKMVDASTQYSPPNQQKTAQTPTSTIAGLHLSEDDDQAAKITSLSAPAKRRDAAVSTAESSDVPTQSKRHAAEVADADAQPGSGGVDGEAVSSAQQSPVKKARPETPPVRMMPIQYENCNTRDLVVLIASMLMELIRYNDAIPLKDGQLTRFHSRAPPGISVLDYLQRLTTHATLSPPILLSVVYYIDRLCAIYPAFTISSLTVHRFLITSSTVASKGLSDSFWTNRTYARVGGVSMKELALLELEFLTRMEWRIVPKPEVLIDYYKSLIGRNSQYQLEGT